MANRKDAAATQTVEVSEIDKTKMKASEYSAISGDAPGTADRTNIVIEGLGNLNEIPDYDPAKEEEGVGEHCVVMSHSHTGAHGAPFKRGDIRRLSKLVNGFDDPKTSKDDKKRAVYRLFSIGAIRLADRQESLLSHIELPLAEDSRELQDERTKRRTLERENEALRLQIEQLQGTAVKETEGDSFD
jgi:hypothetical protein